MDSGPYHGGFRAVQRVLGQKSERKGEREAKVFCSSVITLSLSLFTCLVSTASIEERSNRNIPRLMKHFNQAPWSE